MIAVFSKTKKHVIQNASTPSKRKGDREKLKTPRAFKSKWAGDREKLKTLKAFKSKRTGDPT